MTVAPARTKPTRLGPLSARQRAGADLMSLQTQPSVQSERCSVLCFPPGTYCLIKAHAVALNHEREADHTALLSATRPGGPRPMTALTERCHRAGVGRRTVRSPEWRGRPSLGFPQSWAFSKPVDRRMSWRRRAIRWHGCGSAQRLSRCRSSPRCPGFATVRDGSIPLPGKAEWSLLMVKAGERVRRCAYRRGQNEPHWGEAGMPERGCCGLPGSATAEPDLVLPGLRWR